MSESLNRLEQAAELFERAKALGEAECEAFLSEQCGDDADLAAMLRDMLRMSAATTAAENTTIASRSPQGDIVTLRAGSMDKPGQMIGPFELLEILGEGGFGTVWLAERRQPFVHRVALKIINAGMDTKSVVARFEQERQALAMMDHPNIAKVFDGGVTQRGLPYFVMEHVAGEAITTYCDKHRLTLKERVELFVPICAAVQHAHKNGIIHRDLKPSNILVTLQEGRPVPKVIDFGVAKAISHTLSQKTIFTERGQLVGTPEYMSPEQAEMGKLDIDPRTDVYSLGVVLYELLVGALPFDARTLRSKGFAEIPRIIREVDPPKPSTRLSSLGDGSTDVAKRRNVDVPALQRALSGDLDWITMRAMEKDRTRRYEKPDDLAADLQRHLNYEAVIARPPSISYRTRRWMNRHRTGVVLACTIIIAVSATGSLILYRNFARQQKVDDLVDRAVLLQGQADYAESEKLLLEALNLNPEDFHALSNLATVNRYQFDQSHDKSFVNEAIARLDRAAAICPNRPEPLNLKGLFLRSVGQVDEAIDVLKKGIATDKSYFPTYVTIALAYALKKDWLTAESYLVQADRLPTQDPDERPWHRWHNLAAIQLALDKPEAAIAIKKALAFEKGSANWNVRILEARLKLWLPAAKDVPAAFEAAIMADKLVELSSPQWRIKRVRALAELRKDDLAAAISSAQAAVDLHDPYPAEARLIAAIALAKQKKIAEAQKQFDAAKTAWPNDLEKAPRGLELIPPDSGVTWFESLSEYRALRDEAEAALKS